MKMWEVKRGNVRSTRRSVKRWEDKGEVDREELTQSRSGDGFCRGPMLGCSLRSSRCGEHACLCGFWKLDDKVWRLVCRLVWKLVCRWLCGGNMEVDVDDDDNVVVRRWLDGVWRK